VRKGRARLALTALLVTSLTSACAGGVRHRPEALNYWHAGSRAGSLPAAAPRTPAATAQAAAESAVGGAAPDAPAAVTPDTASSASAPAPAAAARQAAAVTPVRPGGRTVATGPSGPAGTITPAPGSTASSGPPAPATATATASGTRSAGGGGVPGSPPTPAPGGGTTTGVTKDSITLGVFYPRTGAYAGLFRNVPVVVQAALDEAGPIHGRKLILKTYDDGTADAATIQTEEKRARDENFALLSVVSESNAVLAPLADRHRVPLIVGNIDEKVAVPLTTVFSVLPYWARQAKILPGFIQNVLGGAAKRIGIVYEGTSTAIDAKEAFKVKAAELGLRVVFEQPIAQNQSACANEVANLQSHNVELVFMMNGPLGAICMLRDARALGYRPTWTGVGISWEANVVASASGGGAEGIRKLTAFATLETPAGRHFSEVLRRYAPNSGGDNDDVMLLYYGLFQTLLEGLRRAGPDLTREGFVRTFETAMNGFDSGYLPPPTFGPGDRSGPLAVGVVACCTNGRWTTPTPGWRTAF
jgi:branched-chain amino acid transport system substrate-binding protein